MSKLQVKFPQKSIIFSLFILILLAGIQWGSAGEPERAREDSGSLVNGTSHSSMMDMSDLMSMADVSEKETEDAGPLMMNRLMKQSDEAMSESGHSGMYKTSADAHSAMEGILLKADTNETVTPGKRCPAGASTKTFDITAISIEITMNRFLQFYPGYMFVLSENLEKARSEEKRNKEARGKTSDFGADSPGLDGGDVIQPLVIRASQGECVVMTLHNKVDSTKDPVSLHIHGSSLMVKSTGKAAVATNPDTTVEYGKSQTFEWYITPETQEGAHMFHSHLGREQSSLGMMGVFNVEPYGSKYIDPITGKDMKSGWSAMIVDPKGPDFREFTVIYHEVGDEAFRPLEKTGELMEQRDPLIDVYRPGSRALNYRSEPHGTRLAWEKKMFGFTDESQAYGSYMFGDPATPVPRSYLGDPAKWRLVHGGSEMMHSHHLHGGADRWPRQPHAIDQNFSLASNGPVKYPQIRIASDRLDVQNLGPSEVFDETIECGSGGCQAMAGEFLYHCHIQQHYLSGMWAFWRVYNSLQLPGFQTDVMAPLQELPDRAGKMKPPVDSNKLIGTTVSWYGGKKFDITAGKTDWSANPQKVSIKDWVDMMLPPQGMPGKTADEKGQTMAYDASVLDWVWDGNKAMNEKETTYVWPDYQSPAPGQRVPIVFDPLTGKLAWPQLKPHIGKRPPFAPNHGGAPFLEPIHLDKNGHKTTEPAIPGEQGPWSLCPANAPRKYFTVHGIALPLTLKKATPKTAAIVDPLGQLFVLHEEEDEIRKDVDKQWPLVLRLNVGDCGDVIFKSEIPDRENNHFTSKSNMHPHFFQFDTSSSDGVISGFSYDQSVRPFTAMESINHEGAMPRPMNTILSAEVKAGAKSIFVEDGSKFHNNTELGIGMEEVKTFEVGRIKEVKGKEILLTEPLQFNHKKREIASVEFVRYRWYPDVDLGIVYWHDHVFGQWGHGYFGSTVVEPKGSTYHNPKTGKEIRSGPIADIHTTEPVSSQVTGSFREMIMHIEDSAFYASNKIKGVKSVSGSGAVTFNPDMLDTPVPYLDGGEMTTGSGFGTRIEPLNVRLINNPDTTLLFSSRVHGDPDTPLLRSYLGDPLVIRGLVTSTNETHTWHVSGHYFPMERYGVNAIPRNTVHIAIAERYDMVIPAAGGPQRKAGDYPYYSGRTSHFTEGSWGLIRVLDKTEKDLQPLPGREVIPAGSKEICPANAPVKTFNVDAVHYALKFNKKAPEAIEVDFNRHLLVGNKQGKIFVLEGELGKVAGGTSEPSPLTLHVNVGDCLKIHLKNETSDHVSFHVDGLAYDPMDSMGINAGNNPGDQTVAPGKSRVYTFFAHKEWGENAALIQDWGNVISGPRNGLFGAIIIGPAGSKYRDPITGEDVTLKNRWAVDVLIDRSVPGNETRENYRDFSLMFQDEDNIIGTSLMPYLQKVAGLTGVNYRLEPYSWGDSVDRTWCGDPEKLFSCVSSNSNELSTPLLQAHAGDPVTIHVFGAYNEQPAVFSMEGHEWPLEPYMKGADQRSSLTFGGTEVINAILNGGAGGPDHFPGDYLWMNHRLSYMEAGQWGIFRVHPVGDARILPLAIETNTKTAEESTPGIKKASVVNAYR